ncbi:MAG: hypothetical protein A4S17_05455 [Proteobacteria bacterium HN_bin10]|nr:MAG: hypothetical protein A4S17_05455 [Proteobacteria bacterium HN_bin10]
MAKAAAKTAKAVLTERQQKWFASLEASLERDTGKTIAEWVKIAKKCPETTPGKRAQWLREKYSLGVNRIAHILSVAFPQGPGWDEPDALLEQLWKDKESRAIYDAVAKLVRKEFPEAVIGPRKTFVSFSRKIQFAAIIPVKGGKAELGLPLPVSTSKRLLPMKRRPWAEKHTGLLVLSSPKDVDAEAKRLLKLAWEKG